MDERMRIVGGLIRRETGLEFRDLQQIRGGGGWDRTGEYEFSNAAPQKQGRPRGQLVICALNSPLPSFSLLLRGLGGGNTMPSSVGHVASRV
jgi:hypothetical protein